MKNLLAFVLTLTLLMLPVLSLAEEVVAASDGATITVTGSASVTIKADYARVSVGVSTSAKTVEEATAQNNLTIHSVIAALRQVGVAENDVTTSSYTVYAEYDHSSIGGEKLTGYRVTNQLTVIIRDMEHIGATLDKVTAAGANNIHNIEFLSTNSDEAQDEATVYAVQDAIRRARLLADAAGLTLGNIISISDSTSSWGIATRSYASKITADAVGNSILPDDASVSASVTIVFELK